jgi:hypothetical protein
VSALVPLDELKEPLHPRQKIVLAEDGLVGRIARFGQNPPTIIWPVTDVPLASVPGLSSV